ncbi:hypothetical protein [Streptomyces sp. NPDC093149]|uniref:hypothetical protein n=1 Tax=Streptomyces sp. NPDC093149 TaxID=3366031 RepID=UPI0038215594
MARQREEYGELFEGDFGLSALAGGIAASPEPLDQDGVIRLAAEVAADGDGEGAVELGLDLNHLLETGLSDEILDTVWTAVTGDDRRSTATRADTRDRLSRLAARYPIPPGAGAPGPERETKSRADVVAEVRASAADLGHAAAEPTSGTDEPGAALPAALTTIVNHTDEGLGLRLLLRALKTRHLLVTKERYDRLTALGRQLGYPGPLVGDGLSVAWPPIDPARRDGEGDFGLSALTAWFSWEWAEPTARDRLRAAAAADDAAQTPGSAAALLLVDSLRLLQSPLPDDTIATLWHEATGGAHDPGRLGLSPRDWLRTITEACRAHLAEVAPGHRHTTPPVDPAHQDTVLREVRESAAVLGEAPTAAVEDVVTRVDPDLGYRLLLRLLAVRAAPLTEKGYARHLALCRHFHYGAEHVAEAVELLQHR